ncbi:MAG TPA: AAA family ATPase [Dehalococcoidia bacterium]
MSETRTDVPTLVFLFGPPAVGKMTVGLELERLTGYRLFHLHQVVDLVVHYFPYSVDPASSFERLVVSYRRQFFEEAARSGLRMITTAGWRFDLPAEEAAARSYTRPFVERGGRVCMVELSAPLETRIARNDTEGRRKYKNAAWSTEEYLRADAAAHRYDSGSRLPFDLPLLQIDTTHLSAAATAQRIRDHFALDGPPEEPRSTQRVRAGPILAGLTTRAPQGHGWPGAPRAMAGQHVPGGAPAHTHHMVWQAEE